MPSCPSAGMIQMMQSRIAQTGSPSGSSPEASNSGVRIGAPTVPI